jgi:class 3 adenylate cyclase
MSRAGIHVGEVEVRDDDVGGVAVHLAARVMSHTAPDQILATSTVEQTTEGGPMGLVSICEVELKGIRRNRELFAV